MTFVTTACTTLYENLVKRGEIKHVYFLLCLSLTICTGCFNQCEILYSTVSSEMLQYNSTVTCTRKHDIKVCTVEYNLSHLYVLQVWFNCLVRQKLWWFGRVFFDVKPFIYQFAHSPFLLIPLTWPVLLRAAVSTAKVVSWGEKKLWTVSDL